MLLSTSLSGPTLTFQSCAPDAGSSDMAVATLSISTNRTRGALVRGTGGEEGHS